MRQPYFLKKALYTLLKGQGRKVFFWQKICLQYNAAQYKVAVAALLMSSLLLHISLNLFKPLQATPIHPSSVAVPAIIGMAQAASTVVATSTSIISTFTTPDFTIPISVTIEAQSGPIPPVPYFATATPVPVGIYGSVRVALEQSVPSAYVASIERVLRETSSLNIGSWLRRPLRLVDDSSSATITIRATDAVDAYQTQALPLVTQYYAAVVPFDTVVDTISLDELMARWQGTSLEPLYVYEDAALGLESVLGVQRISTLSLEKWQELFENTPDAIGILPFEHLSPKYKVLAVDGVNPLDNQLAFGDYALAAALVVHGKGAENLIDLVQPSIGPQTNRNSTRLTSLLMTGVTAMSRGTAMMMEQKGYTFPAEVISDTLRAADITHISNEVPFLSDCVVNNSRNNLQLCSHFNYWAALEAVGTDVVGLSGNHVNDFGRAGARESLAFYRENGVAIYGSGLTIEEACAPLRWAHNENTFAFIAALAFEPSFAWATKTEPGACYYYAQQDAILETVAQLSQEVDIVAVELQYLETYNPFPTNQQVIEFRALRDAGADIVTGVQSHVPQAMEPYGDDDPGGAGMIAYGLGNLFFDQMWSWETRTELMARHAIYDGKLISTEILTAVLEDFAQPRWTTDEERAALLQRIFTAAPPRPELPPN